MYIYYLCTGKPTWARQLFVQYVAICFQSVATCFQSVASLRDHLDLCWSLLGSHAAIAINISSRALVWMNEIRFLWVFGQVNTRYGRQHMCLILRILFLSVVIFQSVAQGVPFSSLHVFNPGTGSIEEVESPSVLATPRYKCVWSTLNRCTPPELGRLCTTYAQRACLEL